MEARLIFNPNSGGVGDLTPEILSQALLEAGYEPVYSATSSEQDLDPLLADTEGIVVCAGGDGTVRAVATRLIGRDIPIVPLPFGTANNISTSLGLKGDPLDLIARLHHPQACKFDVGRVRGPWGEDYFMEAAGFGFYAEALAAYDPESGKSVLRSITAFADTVGKHDPYRCYITLDGIEVSSEYLMVGALNTASFGPWLKLAPKASPSDGNLDFVFIHEDVRKGLFRYLAGLLSDEVEDLPVVTIKRGKRLEFRWDGFPVHVDAEVRPKTENRPADHNPAPGARIEKPQSELESVVIDILPGALTFWLPQPQEE